MNTYHDPIRGWTITEKPRKRDRFFDFAAMVVGISIATAIVAGIGADRHAPLQAAGKPVASCQPHPAAGPDGRLAEGCK